VRCIRLKGSCGWGIVGVDMIFAIMKQHGRAGREFYASIEFYSQPRWL
jgi:homoaconitase/3-isopropylmalate dehydratase large subunit